MQKRIKGMKYKHLRLIDPLLLIFIVIYVAPLLGKRGCCFIARKIAAATQAHIEAGAFQRRKGIFTSINLHVPTMHCHFHAAKNSVFVAKNVNNYVDPVLA